MGITLARLCCKREARILMVGLDGSGKTAILYCLKLHEPVVTMPTMGYNVETIDYKGISFTLWDAGGNYKIRPLWRHYLMNTLGLIFVVDSSDSSRFPEASEALHKILFQDELSQTTLLVMANKSDLPNACSVDKLTEALNLRTYTTRKWHICETSVYRMDSLHKALDWMAKHLDFD